MKQLIIHNIWFRVLAPIFIGSIIYLLVLMFFDALSQLSTNFFGVELLITLGLTYVVFFLLRQLIRLWQSIFPIEELLKARIIMQFSVGLILSVIVTLEIIGLYFKNILGYSQYMHEAGIFISLFALLSLTYNILYFSLFYLNRNNETAIEREEQMKKLLISDFNGLLRDTRPELFTIGMESLIVQLRKDKKQADKYITTFCDVYRYNLHSRKNELIELREELANLANLFEILNAKYENNIHLENNLTSEIISYKVLPTTLQILTEASVFSSIINKDSPITIQLAADESMYLNFRHNGLPRLTENNIQQDFLYLSDSQKYFTGSPILIDEINTIKNYKIQLITNEIESLE